MIEKFLQEIGLSDKEAKVYIALLSVDTFSVLDLAKKTGINRTTVYPILESLLEKKLIAEVKADKKVVYQAEPPERLETFIEEQKIKLTEQSRLLEEVIPRLKSFSRESGERPIVKYYEGREGILRAIQEYFDTGTKGGTVYLVYPRDLLESMFTPKEREQARGSRLKKDIKAVSIYTYSKGELEEDATSSRVRIDEKKYPISCDINIFQDRVTINTLGEKLSSISIKSKDFAETLTSLFKLAFDNEIAKKNK